MGYTGAVPDANTGSSSLTYAAAGVDTEAGDRAVELMKQSVAATHGPEVLSGAGGFAGLFDASALKDYDRPLLASSTDGVGTKLLLAQVLDKHDTVGVDLVAMVVDDLVACGAKPLVMSDYIACGKVVPERIAQIVGGIARGCSEAGVALVAGETAEHPGVMGEDEYDIAGAAVGVVEADKLLGPDRVRDGDVLVAMASSGVHSNGFSLLRRVVAEAGLDWVAHCDELGTTLGEACLVPTAVYAKTCLALADRVHAFSHITGGGLAANLARVIPAGMLGRVDRATWQVPDVFRVVQAAGRLTDQTMEQTFNQGVGMVAAAAPADADAVIAECASQGVAAWQCGTVTAVTADDIPDDAAQGTKGVAAGAAVLVGQHIH